MHIIGSAPLIEALMEKIPAKLNMLKLQMEALPISRLWEMHCPQQYKPWVPWY